MKKYHVKTQDDYNKLMVELEGIDARWVDNELPTDGNCWLTRRDKTVIMLSDENIITHVSIYNAKNTYQDIPIEIYNSKESGVVDKMNKIDNKVLIPKFAADYIKLTKGGYDISDVFHFDTINARQRFSNLNEWLYENDTKENERRYLMLVNAWINGYEIEEDKYYWALSLENCIQPVFLLDDPQTSEKNYFADTVEDMKDAAYITESEALNILVEDFHMFRKLEANDCE